MTGWMVVVVGCAGDLGRPYANGPLSSSIDRPKPGPTTHGVEVRD